MSSEKLLEQVSYIIAVFVIIMVILILAWPIQTLWNGVIVSVIAGCREMTFWQAVGFEVFVFMLGRIFNMNNKVEKND